MFIHRKDNGVEPVVKEFLAVVAKLSHLLILLMACSLASGLASAAFFLKEHSFQGVKMLIAPRGRTEEPNSRRSARSAAASSPNFKAGSGNKTIV
jgi:hypothetical protein